MTLALDRRRGMRAAALFLLASMMLAGAPVRALENLITVIVEGQSAAAAVSAVRAEGGRIDTVLPLIGGAVAEVPQSRLADLSRMVAVTPDRPMRVQSQSFSPLSNSYGDNLASAYPQEVGAPAMWKKGVTGKGVVVAVVDTGVADVPDLSGRVVRVNVSGELRSDDGFGHGTFMAGLVAGNGASSGGAYVGVAPEATILAVKVAKGDGSTSLAKVLVGLQAVAGNAAARVLLLAVDSGSPLPPEIDPLSQALRTLWARGVTVVVPSGNNGNEPGSVSAPGEDPVLLTAGSVNDQSSGDPTDDSVSDFAGRGPTRWGDEKPDLAAPGEHLVSLRAPGSYIDVNYPSARVDDAYFRGTGTSMSSAVTAGAAALLISALPPLAPDVVKAALMATATAIPAGEADTVGAGVVNAAEAADPSNLPDVLPDAPKPGSLDPKDLFDSLQKPSSPSLALEKPSAPSVRDVGKEVRDADVKDLLDSLRGEGTDARQWAARQWAARQWAARQWAARQWAARQWAARQWATEEWAARQWAARQWTYEAWQARQWTARQWTARQWTQDVWEARQWSARQWLARQWSARQWSARQWSARQWSARQWLGDDWEARQWSARQWLGDDWT